jgi:predicted phosphodiesterase
MLDCGCVSHHNHGKPGATEGLKLLGDSKGLYEALIKPCEKYGKKSLTYIVGNHEDWISDLVNMVPALEGLIDIETLLKLGNRWKIVPNGESTKLGKLVFVHGDQVKGGENPAKLATIAYEANIRFGHHHTFQVFTKTSALENTGHTGIAVPCLCKKNPLYGGGSPNRWMQGFLWGYVNPKDGTFNDYVTVIINGKASVLGKSYGN